MCTIRTGTMLMIKGDDDDDDDVVIEHIFL